MAIAGLETVSVLLGNGDGSFGAPAEYGVGSWPGTVAVADLDGDQKLDLAVANSRAATVSVLFGNGDGTFRAKTDFGTGIYPASVAIGDLNGDGKLDLAVPNWGSNTVSAMMNTGGLPWLGVEAPHVIVGELRLSARPNPLFDAARISYTLPASAPVSLCVYDLAGRLISTLARGTMTAGAHEASWDLSSDAGQRVRAGIYLIELRAGAHRTTTRVAVLL